MKKIDVLNKDTVALARKIYGEEFIPLHRPVFEGNERQYLVDCMVQLLFMSQLSLQV